MDNEPKKQPEKDESQPYSFSDEVTEKKIKKHISDIRDVITEQDIANVKVPGEEDNIQLPPEEKKKEHEKKDDGFTEGKPITPWDIID